MSAQRELEDHLNRIIEEGAGLDEIMAALEENAVLDDAPADDMGRPVAPVEGGRGYWNIKDAAQGDTQKARDLAEWAVRKYGEAEDAIAAAQEAADRQIAQVWEWLAEQTKHNKNRMDWFLGVLDLYQHDFAPEDKTTKLVAGEIRRRAMPPKLSRDEDEALEWARQRADVDEIAPRRLAASALNARLKEQPDGTFVDAETGEAVDFQRKVANPTPYSLTVKVYGKGTGE